jgi:hypothetical protein
VVGPGAVQDILLCGSTGRGDHRRTEELGHLDRSKSDARCACQNQHNAVWSEARKQDERAVGGEILLPHRSGFKARKPSRHPLQRRLRHDAPFAIDAVALNIEGWNRRNLLTDGELLNTIAHGFHHARALATDAAGQAAGRQRINAAAKLHLGVVEADGFDPDSHLAGTRLLGCSLLERQFLRSARPV